MEQTEGFVTFSLTNGPEYHISQVTFHNCSCLIEELLMYKLCKDASLLTKMDQTIPIGDPFLLLLAYLLILIDQCSQYVNKWIQFSQGLN